MKLGALDLEEDRTREVQPDLRPPEPDTLFSGRHGARLTLKVKHVSVGKSSGSRQTNQSPILRSRSSVAAPT